MTSTSTNFTAAAATAFALAFFAVTPAAQAADYCITSGAQAAHGCGFATMEACRATAAGIGGTCSPSGSSRTNNPGDELASSRAANPNNALAFEPQRPHARRTVRSRTRSIER